MDWYNTLFCYKYQWMQHYEMEKSVQELNNHFKAVEMYKVETLILQTICYCTVLSPKRVALQKFLGMETQRKNSRLKQSNNGSQDTQDKLPKLIKNLPYCWNISQWRNNLRGFTRCFAQTTLVYWDKLPLSETMRRYLFQVLPAEDLRWHIWKPESSSRKEAGGVLKNFPIAR